MTLGKQGHTLTLNVLKCKTPLTTALPHTVELMATPDINKELMSRTLVLNKDVMIFVIIILLLTPS